MHPLDHLLIDDPKFSKEFLITRDPKANNVWHQIYPALSAGKPGLRAILSADGGHTWTAAGSDYGFSIDPDVYGYARGIQMPDGSIFIVYIRNGGHNADQLKQEAILAVRMRVLPDCKGIELLPAPGG